MSQLDGFVGVPSVQEMAKQPFTNVPSRYAYNDQDPSFVSSSTTTSTLQVPVIDLGKMLSGDSNELERFDIACKQWGFFQLVNHGVSDSLLDKVKLEIKNFYDLPIEDKRKYWQKEGDIEGFGQAFVMSEEHKLNWVDMFHMLSLPKRLRKPHLLPMLPDQFRDVLEIYSEELKKLGLKVLNLMAKALIMDPKDIDKLYGEGELRMTTNYYPPCPQPDQTIGLKPHSDAGGLTMLVQINETAGLQIKKDDSWIAINPLPNAFIINIGDMLEILTNGIYRSIEHRAIVNSFKERLSIATFYSPSLDGDLGPAPSLINTETPAVFKRTKVADYYTGFFTRDVRDKSYVNVLRIDQNEEEQKTN